MLDGSGVRRSTVFKGLRLSCTGLVCSQLLFGFQVNWWTLNGVCDALEPKAAE